MKLCPAFHNCRFVGSCNGLICFVSWDKNYYGPIYICNPITREYVILPNHHERKYWWNGFCYSPSTSEYKVVRVFFHRADPNCGVAHVYTVGRGNGWRNLGEVGVNMKYLRQSAGVFANGSLHWMNHDDGTVLAFHATDEKFSEFPLPREVVPDSTVRLGGLGDFLSARYYHHDNRTSEIWILKKNKDNSDLSWSDQFTFDKYVELSFEFAKSGTRLLCCSSDEIYSYDPKASPAKIDLAFDIHISEAIPHKNTLLSLKALGKKDMKTMEFHERAR